MIMTQRGSGAPWLQRSWDSRAACNFIGGGSGAGLLVAATAAKFAGWPYFPAGMLAIALICFGLSMVWLEIGRPFRAVNVFFHPQTSWMSSRGYFGAALAGVCRRCGDHRPKCGDVTGSDKLAGNAFRADECCAGIGVPLQPGAYSQGVAGSAGVARALAANGHCRHWNR